MTKRRCNPRLPKLHRSYTVEEIASLYGIHRGTVRQWIKKGLPVCDSKRPLLILGQDLREFLQARRTGRKQRCQIGELYCFRCRAPRKPAGAMADFQPVTPRVGNLVAICPVCETLMNQRIGLVKLERIRTQIDITFTQAEGHIGDRGNPSVNSDFNEVAKP